MKRKTKLSKKGKLPDKTRKIEIYLAGGPAHGETHLIRAGEDTVEIGPFTYTYAGKIDQRTYYAIKLKSRAATRAINKVIEKFGKDPRIEAILSRPNPIRVVKESPHGRGARKRAVRRSLAGSAMLIPDSV
jgi:hypothetical protein